tara:strand:- start:83 stop:316 length:234 start_codon:yes stop_codon:yes gene_type:complete
MNVAKVSNGHIIDHGVGDESNILYANADGEAVVPFPDWALEIRTENLKNKIADKVLVWNYETREFTIKNMATLPENQ